MRLFTCAAAAAAVLLAAGAASAQDTSLAPTYGTSNLSAGFQPDPLNISVRSGGGLDATQTIAASCQGWVARAPDYRVNYTAGSLPFYISADSRADVTLIVNGPDGQWYCDDDTGEGLNPWVVFNKPRSGQYDIWIGTYGQNTVEDATLSISELTHR
jgi:hypothetical protein